MEATAFPLNIEKPNYEADRITFKGRVKVCGSGGY
jgi:hypothetical protein